MTSSKATGLNIKAVAEQTGVALHTLRAWERRYGVPSPKRQSHNRYRLYSNQDIADVLWMKRHVELGISPAQASALLREQPAPAFAFEAPPDTTPVIAAQDALLDAFTQRDEAAAQRIFNEAWSTFAPEQVVLEIIQPVMRALGEGWQRNLLSVEQEHFASNLVRQRLHVLIQAQAAPALTAPRVVAACAPEEQHDLGLLIFTYLAKRQGWSVVYLGQRTPLTDLYRSGRGAQFIVLSATTVTGLASLVSVWSQSPLGVPILFGGNVFDALPALQHHLPGAFLGENRARAFPTLASGATSWKPPRKKLNAALAVQAERLEIAGGTARHFGTAMLKTNLRSSLTDAASFLTDALISALAFDAPELMEAQAGWANEFMPAHQIELAMLHAFLNSYQENCARVLASDHAKLVHELTGRFRAAIDYAPAFTQEVS